MSAAQAIRRAAIDDSYGILSNEERAVLAAYTDRPVVPVSWTHYRTWMLFVAEELSPTLPVGLMKAAIDAASICGYTYSANALRDLLSEDCVASGAGGAK